MRQQTVIGVVGPAGGGKDTVAAYLAERHGFTHVSTGDLIRQNIIDNQLGELGRGLERVVAKQLRDEHGADYLVQQALARPDSRLVISGLRTAGEVQAVQDGGGTVLAVTASQRSRYERTQGRGRGGDRQSFEQFTAIEAEEAANDDPNMQNVAAVTAAADVTITNDGSLNELQSRVDDLVAKVVT